LSAFAIAGPDEQDTSFLLMIEDDGDVLVVLRYVEANLIPFVFLKSYS
jgi:hypothetical protein